MTADIPFSVMARFVMALFFLMWWKEALVELVSGVGDGHQGGDAHGHIPRGKHPNSLALPQSGAPNPLYSSLRKDCLLRETSGREDAARQEGEAHGQQPHGPPRELNSLARPQTGRLHPLTACLS